MHQPLLQLSYSLWKKGTPLLGMDLVSAVDLQICGVSVVTSSPPETVQQLDTVETPLIGCAKGFVHWLKLCDGVRPVQQKQRRLPLSVKEAVSKELVHLQAACVFHKVDASPWVSPVFVT